VLAWKPPAFCLLISFNFPDFTCTTGSFIKSIPFFLLFLSSASIIDFIYLLSFKFQRLYFSLLEVLFGYFFTSVRDQKKIIINAGIKLDLFLQLDQRSEVRILVCS
jgi:hypothetical protein